MALFNALVRPVVLALARPGLADPGRGPGARPPGPGVPRRRATAPRASTSTASCTALVGSFVYAIINTVLTAILGVDSGGSYYGLLVQSLLVKRSTGPLGQARAS